MYCELIWNKKQIWHPAGNEQSQVTTQQYSYCSLYLQTVSVTAEQYIKYVLR